MKKTISFLTIIILCFIFVACGNSNPPTNLETPPTNPETPPSTGDEGSSTIEGSKPDLIIKFASAGPADPENPMNAGEIYFKEIVEERSAGKIEVELYMAGALGNVRTVMEGIQLGTIEMGEVENGVMGNFVDSAAIWDLPFMFDSYEHAYAVMDGELGDELREDFLDIGVRHLGYNNGGFRYFFSNKRPPNNKKNMEGLKIRVMETSIMLDTINSFGASAVPIAFGELYTALQQGTVDGQDMPIDMFVAQSYFEVQDYMVWSEHFFMPRQYLINEEFYQSLPTEYQTLISECALDACLEQRRLFEEYCENGVQLMLDNDMEIYYDFDYDYFKPIGLSLWPEYLKKIGGGNATLGEERVKAVRALVE